MNIKLQRFLFIFGFGGLTSLLLIVALLLYEPLMALVFIVGLLHTIPIWIAGIKGKSYDLFQPINFCLLSSFILFVLKPLYYYFSLNMRIVLITREFTESSVTSLVNKAEILVILGLIALYLGYYSRLASRGARHVPVLPSNWPKFRVKSSIFVLVALSLFSVFFFFLINGTLDVLISSFNLRASPESGLKIFYRLGVSGISIAFLLWIAFGGKQVKTYKILFFLSIVVIYTSLFLSRTPVISLILTTLLFRYYFVKKITFKKVVIVVMVILIFAYSILYLRSGERFRNKLGREPIMTFIDKNMFSDKAFLLLLEETPHNLPFLHGRSLANSIMFFLPRVLYPDKPIDISIEITRKYFERVRGGFNITFPGELYINFSIPGILLGMYILGVFAGILKNYLALHPNNRGVVLIYAASCFWLFDIIYKDLWHFFAGITWNVLLLALVIFFFKIRFSAPRPIIENQRLPISNPTGRTQ